MGLPNNHPVRAAYPRGKRGFYAKGPRSAEVVLLQGEVTCISCHACNELDRHRTVTGAGDEFCRSCHER